jgi:hypothetical protein
MILLIKHARPLATKQNHFTFALPLGLLALPSHPMRILGALAPQISRFRLPPPRPPAKERDVPFARIPATSPTHPTRTGDLDFNAGHKPH